MRHQELGAIIKSMKCAPDLRRTYTVHRTDTKTDRHEGRNSDVD